MEKEWKIEEAAINDWTGTTLISGSKQMFMHNNLRNIKEPQNKAITANSNNQNHISIHKQWHNDTRGYIKFEEKRKDQCAIKGYSQYSELFRD